MVRTLIRAYEFIKIVYNLGKTMCKSRLNSGIRHRFELWPARNPISRRVLRVVTRL
jgi:hypothetical protein